jgi:hypothetical protein
MSFLATTGGITGDNVHDLILAAVEHCFGLGQSPAGHD